MSIQFIYTNLDAVSVSAGYLISKNGYISDDVIALVREETGASIEQIGDSPALIGSIFEYRIYKDYEPLIIDEDVMEIAVTRSIIIGYYS